ncbi:MAG: hypothetical protein ACNA7V_11215 [Bacteroidales bacterium]
MVRIIILALSITIIFSGCIEIEEKIVIKSDQSGSVSYSVNTSEVGSLLVGLSGLLGIEPDEQINDEAEKLISILKEQPGIHNISYNLKHSKGRYYLRFDFTDAASFNKALYRMGGQKKTIFSPGYLKINHTRFRKLNFSPYLTNYLQKEGKEVNSLLYSDLLIFRSEIHFPEKIKRTNKKELLIAPDQTSLSQKFKFRDILENNSNTGIKVRF